MSMVHDNAQLENEILDLVITPHTIYVRMERMIEEARHTDLLDELQTLRDTHRPASMVFDLTNFATVPEALITTFKDFGRETCRQGWTVRFLSPQFHK